MPGWLTAKYGICLDLPGPFVLQVGEGLYLGVAVVIKREFAKVDGASLGRNGPENISQIFEAELGGIFEAFEPGFDLEIGLLAFDLRFAGGALHQVAAVEVDASRSALQAIVHRFGRARDGRRGYVARGGSRRDVRRRSGLRGRERRGGREDNGQTQFFHSVSRSGGDRDF